MNWRCYIDLREQRRQRCLRWAPSPPPAPAVFGAWRFRDDDALRQAALSALRDAALSPSPAQRWVHLAAPSALPTPAEPDTPRPAWQHLGWLAEQAGALEDASPTAWALCALDVLGCEVERRERQAWADVRYPLAPQRDQQTAALWAQWLDGDPWSLRAPWESLFLSATVRTFRGVCEARRLPPDVVTRAVRDLEEGFFYRLVGGDGVPGWAELAARVLETDGPVQALAEVLDEAAWDRLSRCAATRGSWQESCQAIWTALPEAGSRARALMQSCQEAPPWLDAWMDLHVVRRLLSAWEANPSVDPWGVVSQNRGRARGRLRALAAANTADGLRARLLALPGLHARTLAAVRRYAWAWAWQEMALDFSFDIARPVTPPCEDVALLPAPFSDDERPAIETWVLLVVLRGRLSHLRRWVASGSTGDRDSTWARLLTDSLPDDLSEAQPGKRARSYRRLRVDLAEHLDDHLDALRPVLSRIAALEAGRGLKGRFHALLATRWDGRVPMPRSGFPSFLTNATAVAQESP